MPLDQLAHRPAGPPAERKPQLVRVLLDDAASDPVRLVGAQSPLAAPRRHPPSIEHAILALLAMALEPDVHRLAVDAHHLRSLALAQALLLDQDERPAAQLFLRRPTDAAEVSCLHAGAIAPAAQPVRYICGRLVPVVQPAAAVPPARPVGRCGEGYGGCHR